MTFLSSHDARLARLREWATRADKVTSGNFDYDAALVLAREIWASNEQGGVTAPARDAMSYVNLFNTTRHGRDVDRAGDIARNSFASLKIALGRLIKTLGEDGHNNT